MPKYSDLSNADEMKQKIGHKGNLNLDLSAGISDISDTPSVQAKKEKESSTVSESVERLSQSIHNDEPMHLAKALSKSAKIAMPSMQDMPVFPVFFCFLGELKTIRFCIA